MATKLTKPAVRELRRWLEEKLPKREDLELRVGSASFSEFEVTFKLEIRIPRPDGKTEEQARFEEQAKWYGLELADFGKEITLHDNVYRIAGVKPRASKRPIVIEGVRDGKKLVVGDEWVRVGLGRPRKLDPGKLFASVPTQEGDS